jgi:hypothetical protein
LSSKAVPQPEDDSIARTTAAIEAIWHRRLGAFAAISVLRRGHEIIVRSNLL